MEDLNYTDLEDIKEFLETLHFKWHGDIITCKNIRHANIEDFKYSACLLVKNLKTSKNQNLRVYISDENFHIEKINPTKKYDVVDYSLQWQTFMIERKPTSYAKKICKKSVFEKQKIENEYNEKINLIQKQIQKLEYEKNLKSATLNTVVFNAKHKLKRNLQTNKNINNTL